MSTKVPILNHCTLAPDNEHEITIEYLSGYLTRNQNMVFPHRHDFYHCVLFTSGNGSHQIDFDKFQVEPWQIYFMEPGQIHTWNFEGDMEGYVINMDADSFKTLLLRADYFHHLAFFDGTNRNSVFVIREKNRMLIDNIFKNCLSNPDNDDFIKISLLYCFKLLEQQISPKSIEVSNNYNYTLLRNFNALLEEHYRTLRFPKEYANLLYITPHHLNALCRDLLGQSAGEMIRKRIILEAKRLLAIKGFSISEIAYELNFNDNSYFTKFFKKSEGMNPEDFRNTL